VHVVTRPTFYSQNVENTAHIAKQKLSSKLFSTLLKTETNELRCANAGSDWLRLYSSAWIYRSGRFVIQKQKQIIGTFCSIVYHSLSARSISHYRTENKYGVQMQHRTVNNSFWETFNDYFWWQFWWQFF